MPKNGSLSRFCAPERPSYRTSSPQVIRCLFIIVDLVKAWTRCPVTSFRLFACCRPASRTKTARGSAGRISPDPTWLCRPDVMRGIHVVGRAGLAYDLLVQQAQWQAALELAPAMPDVRFV